MQATSYREQGCSISEDEVLTCTHCEKPCGARVESVLLASSCGPSTEITNDGGALKCRERLPPNADDVPSGSYLGSCYGCASQSGVLSCTCFSSARAAVPSTLELAGCAAGSIGNSDGVLQCSQPPQGLSVGHDEL